MTQLTPLTLDYAGVPAQWRSEVRAYIEHGLAPSQDVRDVLECTLALNTEPPKDPDRAALASWLFHLAPSLCHGMPSLVDNWLEMGGLPSSWREPAADPSPINMRAASGWIDAGLVARKVMCQMPAQPAFAAEFRAMVEDFKARNREAIAKADAERAARELDPQPTIEDLRKQLSEAEAQLDPFFGHSEDSRVYNQGLRAQNKVNALRLRISQMERGL